MEQNALFLKRIETIPQSNTARVDVSQLGERYYLEHKNSLKDGYESHLFNGDVELQKQDTGVIMFDADLFANND